MGTLADTIDTGTGIAVAKADSGCARGLLLVQLREYVSCDSWLCRKLGALAGLVIGLTRMVCGRSAKAFHMLARIHRSDYSEWASRFVERWVRTQLRKDARHGSRLTPICESYLTTLSATSATAKFHENPCTLLGTRALVLKSPAVNEKGVVLIDYTFALSLFAKKFDVRRIAERYYIVLEPTWCGYCDLDILCYTKFDFPVFVQAPEPRDAAFLESIGSNLIPLPVGGNWWVDHRVYRPLPGVAKDVDVIMIAAWGRYKRHFKAFSALARLRAAGRRLKMVLVGYPLGYTRDEILRQAAHYGVADQLEIYENLSPEEVNRQYNRARINLLWSRKEGFNRAIIEGMCAGVPCILRAGHNFGWEYDYINAQTGCFSDERELPRKLLWLLANGSSFAPREWVLQHMSCLRGTEALQAGIKQVASAAGEDWTRDLAVKVCFLNAMRYWDEAERIQFEDDYAFLRSTIVGDSAIPIA